MAKQKIPDKETCIDILKKHNVPQVLIDHSLKVSQLAVMIAKKLIDKGETVNISLVRAAALLHDLDKVKTLDDHKKHGRIGYEILTTEGYLNVAEITIKHNLKSLINGDITRWEELIVNYSDKRVIQDKIVSLDQRIEYIKKKYPEYYSEKEGEACYKAEKEIFSKLDITPDNVSLYLKNDVDADTDDNDTVL